MSALRKLPVCIGLVAAICIDANFTANTEPIDTSGAASAAIPALKPTTLTPMPPGTPVTITTQARFRGALTHQAELCLAALFVDAEAGEGLRLRLVNRAMGWFPLWKLEVVAPRDWTT